MAGVSGSRQVVIVGGGFAGLFAARILARAPVRVTLIDRAEHHLFQPLLYQCATGILSEGKIAAPLRQLLKSHRNVEFVIAEVTGLDPAGPCGCWRGGRSAGGALTSRSVTTTWAPPPTSAAGKRSSPRSG